MQTSICWLRRDVDVVWHGFTQMATFADNEPIIVDRAEGHELIGVDGRRYLDAMQLRDALKARVAPLAAVADIRSHACSAASSLRRRRPDCVGDGRCAQRPSGVGSCCVRSATSS